MDGQSAWLFSSSFFYLEVRSARELDRGTEYLALPPPRVSSCNGPKSTGVTVWRGNTICVITLAVFMGDGIINKPPPTTNPPYTSRHPPHSPRPSSPLLLSSPLALLPPHHHCTIHAYLNHTRPIKKKRKKEGKKKRKPRRLSWQLFYHFQLSPGQLPIGGPLCRSDMQARKRRLELGERRKRMGEGQRRACVCVCARMCVCVRREVGVWVRGCSVQNGNLWQRDGGFFLSPHWI